MYRSTTNSNIVDRYRDRALLTSIEAVVRFFLSRILTFPIHNAIRSMLTSLSANIRLLSTNPGVQTVTSSPMFSYTRLGAGATSFALLKIDSPCAEDV